MIKLKTRKQNWNNRKKSNLLIVSATRMCALFIKMIAYNYAVMYFEKLTTSVGEIVQVGIWM